jgi:hypothetical protein
MMEDQRCNMAASGTDDCRCTNLLDSAINETQDPRYKNLNSRNGMGVEDSRCSRVEMKMEDPRCNGLSSIW